MRPPHSPLPQDEVELGRGVLPGRREDLRVDLFEGRLARCRDGGRGRDEQAVEPALVGLCLLGGSFPGDAGKWVKLGPLLSYAPYLVLVTGKLITFIIMKCSCIGIRRLTL